LKIGAAVLMALSAAGCKPAPAPQSPPPASVTNTTTVPAKAVSTNAVPSGAISTNTVSTNVALMATNAPPVPSRTRDLGVVQLTNHCETEIELGGGKSCTIKTLLMNPEHLQLTVALETRLADGKTRGLKVMKVVTRPSQQFEVDFGSMALTLTPQLVVE
jgi:hypothetical protein